MIAAATAPPERRGVERDGVRLLVARPAGVAHHRFSELPSLLDRGDLLVINTSATLPAALDAMRDGVSVPLHVAAQLDDGSWVVEMRRRDGLGPDLGGTRGLTLQLPGEVSLRLLEPYPEPAVTPSRLWRAAPQPATQRVRYLSLHGRPIRYGHVPRPLPLGDFQNVYAADPGSAEMASAGRPLTERLLTRLATSGVLVVPLLLHAGVSSPEYREPPAPEWFEVHEASAATVNAVRRRGGRVVATGTTVVRALEAAAGGGGVVRPSCGWTDVVLGADRPAQVVNGLITGIHEPESSHLRLLEAVAGGEMVRAAYQAAEAHAYLGHEFGDSMLLLP